MGQGADLAREDNPEHAEIIDNFKDQFLIVLLKRLGGNVTIPVRECDDTGGDFVVMNVDQENKAFNFEVRKKN